MNNDKTTLAEVQPGGRVRLEQERRDHRWDDVGERCLDCGDKDWMGSACSGPRAPEITAPWSSIGMAPSDGEQHIRGLWVTSLIDGNPGPREWHQFIGLVNDDGAFVDPEYGETFGWEADEYDAWMPVAAAPGAALTAQPSRLGSLDLEAMLTACVPGGDIADPQVIADNIRHWFAAQPSPGGQDALDCIGRIEEAIEFRVPHDIYAAVHGQLADLKAALAARQPAGEPVAFMVRWKTAGGFGLEWPKNMQYFRDRADEYEIAPLYAAPAQTVDLAPVTIPDTPEVRDILGRPNFWCSPWANVLRMRGDSIPRKAEEEQAAVIRFMLNHYLANGADWAETAGAELDVIRKADGQAVGNG